MIAVVMGVSGAGKTTIGKLLAERLGWEFLEGDDFHAPQNIAARLAAAPEEPPRGLGPRSTSRA